MNVKLTKEQKIRVEDSKDIAYLMRQVLLRDNKRGREREHFWVIGLDAGDLISYIELVSLGTHKRTLVEPMEVFSFALQKHCAAIVLVHNHPSGKMDASAADRVLTDRLIQVGKIVLIEVRDHVIISSKDNGFYSFVDTGLMQKLEESTDFVPPYKLIEQAKKLATDLAKKAERIKIAQAFKLKGVDVKTIAAATGLTEKEIDKL